MRKVLALLLACMLPFCALAETYGVSVAIDTDEMLFINYLRMALMTQPDVASDPQLDTYVRLIQKLLHGLSFEVAFQEDAVALSVLMGGGRLLDVFFHAQDGRMLIISSLLEGYALEETMAPGVLQENDAQTALELDWKALTGAMAQSITNWISGLEPVVTNGYFVGDAYEGGTRCKTWALEDKDIAALVEAIFSDEVRGACAAVLKGIGLDQDVMLSKLDSANARVVKENTYRYLLRAVMDDQGALVGCSLTVYSDTAQMATVSVGFLEKETRLVFGFGVQDKNYWCEMTATAKEHNKLTLLSGQCVEWVTDKEQSFAYVKSAVEPVSNLSWYCHLTKSGQRYLWDACIYEGDEAMYTYYFSSEGSVIPASSMLDCSFSIGDSPYTPLTVKLKAGPVDEIPEMDATLQRCSMSDPADAALYQELIEHMSSVLLARLIKLIPLDLLLDLSMPQMP